jgi:hypothetical protein
MRDELLPTEGQAPVPAVAGLHSNYCFIDEHQSSISNLQKSYAARDLSGQVNLDEKAPAGAEAQIARNRQHDPGLTFRTATLLRRARP